MRRCAGLAGLLLFALAACGGHSNGRSPSGGGAGAGAGAGATSADSNGGTAAAGGVAGGMHEVPGSGHGGAAGVAGGEMVNESAGAAGAGASECGAGNIEGLNVFSRGSWDPLGYPPYAIDGCRLAYVAPEGDGGALYLRELASGEQVLLESADRSPRRPALSGDLVAWEVDLDGKSQVRVRYQGELRELTGPFDHAAEPRVTEDALVFTGFLAAGPDADSDVYLYEPATGSLRAVAAASGQQRFADVSLDYVALTDFSEDPLGYFNEAVSVANVVLYRRATGSVIVRERDGKQAFPLLGSDGALVYLDWAAVHPEPKFSQFSLRAGSVAAEVTADVDLKGAPVHTSPAYVRPSLRGRLVDFIDTDGVQVGLYRVALEGQSAPVQVPIAGSPQLFGPVTSEAFTLVAKPFQGQTLALTAVAR